jgi:hypothetical protein
MKKRALSVVASTASVVLVAGIGVTPANASDTDYSAQASSWSQAADFLGTAGSLWRPAYAGGLKKAGLIDVLGSDITVADGVATGGSTFAGVTYGSGATSLSVVERWARTSWAAEPATDIRRALVGRETVMLGDPGTQIAVTATIYANCYTEAMSGDAPPPPKNLRCSRADVKKYGGTLVMTAKPPSTMTAPGTTRIQMDSTGLSYKQLVRAANSLTQVMGSLEVAPSAQMVGMCEQMAQGGMTLAQASAFAESNGYSLRVGTVDGEPMAVTADYRPDRFTVSLESGAVVGCTYG